MKNCRKHIVIILLMGIAFGCQTPTKQNHYQYVNTLIGSSYTDHGNTIVGPQTPWGAISPGPDCAPRAAMTDGYDVDLQIKGFSQKHTNGAGGPGHYGNFLFSPQIGILRHLKSCMT